MMHLYPQANSYECAFSRYTGDKFCHPLIVSPTVSFNNFVQKRHLSPVLLFHSIILYRNVISPHDDIATERKPALYTMGFPSMTTPTSLSFSMKLWP